VVAQMALATLVLAAAGLLVRSLVQLQRTDLGLESRGVLTTRIELPKSRYRALEKRLQFLDGLLEHVRTIPGVVSAAVSSSVLLGPLPDSTNFTQEGAPEATPGPMTLDGVTPDFFRALGMSLRQGRSFTEDDRPGTTMVAVINETAARRHWGNVNPVGRRFKLGSGDDSPWLTIVGVVADARRAGADQPPFAESYQPYWQYPSGTMVVLVRSSADPASVAPLVRSALRELDRELPLGGVATLDQLLDERAAGRRFTASLLAGYGSLAIVLTGVGLYGLLAYLVTLRQQEIAVRLALGATRAAVLRLVLGQAFAAAAIGALAGAAAAVGAARLMRGLLFGIHPADPVTHLTVGAMLCAAALLAAWAPGRRAVRVDPMVVLRSQ
jgi:putative ABC transport system permease protein